MTTRNEILQYVIDEYYDRDIQKASDISGYSKARIANWLSGKSEPQKVTIQYFLQRIFVPEFQVIAEYAEFDSDKALQTQLKTMLGEHATAPGIYAFYDALGNLIYLGKATKLMGEIASAMKRNVEVKFPKGIKNKPQGRTQVVKYISAYDVGNYRWNDFPKHVESLMLRISKPLLNKNIGFLGKVLHQPKEA